MAEFNPRSPSIARVYDYFLGGKDNFAADRDLADQQIKLTPLIPAITRENRQFLARAVAWAAGEGIGQFIDLGCGMPTAPNTLESARAVTAGARVAYVDNDPVVISHLSALLINEPGVTVVDGDAFDAPAILDSVRAGIDLSAPVCLVMGYLLHFLTAHAARDLVARYAAALAPGSALVLSAVHVDEENEEGFRGYSSAVTPVYNHSVSDFASFFGPREVLQPGVVDARQWRTWAETAGLPRRNEYSIVGVARI